MMPTLLPQVQQRWEPRTYLCISLLDTAGIYEKYPHLTVSMRDLISSPLKLYFPVYFLF